MLGQTSLEKMTWSGSNTAEVDMVKLRKCLNGMVDRYSKLCWKMEYSLVLMEG